MKSSHQIAILAAVSVGAYLLLRSSTASAGTVRPISTTYPYGIQTVPPQVGTPAYAAYQAQQQQAALDAQKIGLLGSVGKMVNGWFTGGSSSAAAPGGYDSTWTGTGFNLGTNGTLYVPPQDGNAGEAAAAAYYINNPDAFAVNPPNITDYQTQLAMQEGMSEY